ncbi:transcription factor 7-like 2 [Oreochromis aureus]|uniref:transcription factor 7-like 2 n=1 Tax=Oreochromis aureus TaxID=47969 RepID=UPI001953B19B|nr:transcription factor 7-like 2 [Oreochromis aureus]
MDFVLLLSPHNLLYQLPVNNIPATTTATVLPAPPPHSCAPKKHQTKQGKDQAYIKKPPNAFMLYLKEQRPKVKAQLNISDSAAVNAAVGERWKSLSKKEQKIYFSESV